MNPFIINISRDDAKSGAHPYSPNTVLIQIADPPGDFVTPKHQFTSVHRFQFLDLEADDECDDEEMRIQQWQADRIVALLQQALFENKNVVVACNVGVARSGAVCEIGVQMGFQDLGQYRKPNRLVYTRLARALGW